MKNGYCKKPFFSIGHNVRKWREYKGVKQELLAKSLKVDKTIISRIENDRVDLCISRLAIIATVLEIDVVQLFSSPEEYFSHLSDKEKQWNLQLIYELISQLEKKNQLIETLIVIPPPRSEKDSF